MGWIVEAEILDQTDSDSMSALFSNRLSDEAGIIDLSYENARIGGCGKLEMTVTRERAAGHTVTIGNKIKVYASESASDTRDQKYIGFINEINTDYDNDLIEIVAVGYWEQFKWVIISKYMECTDVEDIVDDIMTDILSQTYCGSSTTTLSSSATIGDCEFEFEKASAAIKALAEVQEDIDYGVNEDGNFYFVDSTTTKREHFQLGVNARGLQKKQKIDKLYNDVFVDTKKVVSSGTLKLHEDDDSSVTAYGRRSKKLSSPEFTDAADCLTWAEAKLAVDSEPKVSYEFEPLLKDTYYPYTGKMTLADADGTDLGTLFIDSVTYSFSDNGFEMDIKLGDREETLGEALAEIEREVEIMKSSSLSLTKIEHKAYDTFKQYVYKNALASERYNIIVTEFEEDAV